MKDGKNIFIPWDKINEYLESKKKKSEFIPLHTGNLCRKIENRLSPTFFRSKKL